MYGKNYYCLLLQISKIYIPIGFFFGARSHYFFFRCMGFKTRKICKFDIILHAVIRSQS